MRNLINSWVPSVRIAAVLAVALLIGSTAAVDAKRPPKPPPSPSGSASVVVAPSGALEPNGEYATVDVTATCPVGWTWSYGRLYVLQGDRGGAGTFSVPCTGTPQVAHVRVVNGNRFQLGNWTASAYVGIERNGQQVTATSTRTIPARAGRHRAGGGPGAADRHIRRGRPHRRGGCLPGWGDRSAVLRRCVAGRDGARAGVLHAHL